MTKETLLIQYQSKCWSAFKSVVNIPNLKKTFMAIPNRINFLQLGRLWTFFRIDTL